MERNDLVYICSPLSAPTKEGIRKNMDVTRHFVVDGKSILFSTV